MPPSSMERTLYLSKYMTCPTVGPSCHHVVASWARTRPQTGRLYLIDVTIRPWYSDVWELSGWISR